MAHSYVPIERQEISHEMVDAIAAFLKAQPKWRHLKEEEYEEGSGWRAKDGVEQHWLWQAKNKATSWDDFDMKWGTDKDPYYITVDRKHLIMPGELFLCDLVGGQLWIGRLKRTAARFKAEKVACISDNMQRDYGNSFNGYAVLPELDIE